MRVARFPPLQARHGVIFAARASDLD